MPTAQELDGKIVKATKTIGPCMEGDRFLVRLSFNGLSMSFFDNAYGTASFRLPHYCAHDFEIISDAQSAAPEVEALRDRVMLEFHKAILTANHYVTQPELAGSLAKRHADEFMKQRAK